HFDLHLLVEFHDDGGAAVLTHDFLLTPMTAHAAEGDARDAGLEQRRFDIGKAFGPDDSGDEFHTGKATPGPACCQRNCASIARFDVQRFLCHGAPSATRAHNVASNAQIRCHGAIGPSELPTSQTLPFVTAHGTVEPLLRPGG